MTSKASYYWFSFFALCFGAFQLISGQIRPHYQGGNDWLLYFLGIAPNFFPAIGIPALFVIILPHLNKKSTNKWLNEYKHLLANAISTSGLLAWEFIQLTPGRLVFDWHDVLWTILGASLFQLIWWLSPLKFRQ